MMTAVIACSAAAGIAQASRPASDAERVAAGFDDPRTIVMVDARDSNPTNEVRAPEGIAGLRYQTRIGTAFHGRNDTFVFSGEPPSISCATGTAEKFATATLDLADGASIRYVDVFGYDGSSAENLRVFLLSLCQSTGDVDPPAYSILGDVATVGSPGDTIATINLLAAPVVVDAYSCKYLLRASMTTTTGADCVGGSIFLDKARVEYLLP